MARTVTYADTEIQHIGITQVKEGDPTTLTGYTCTVDYFILDGDGKEITHKNSIKATSGTSFTDMHLSADSNKIVTDFVTALKESMFAREEI